MTLYNASKAFVHGLSRSIAVDHGPDFRCNIIAPGWIETGMLEAGFNLATKPASARQDAIDHQATHHFAHPQGITTMAIWLTSDAATFVTSQIFTVDGGLTTASPINSTLL